MAEIPTPRWLLVHIGYYARAKLLDVLFGLERRIRSRWNDGDPPDPAR